VKNHMNKLERIRLLDSLPVQGIEHFGRPLKDHLVGTHDLLENWGCTEDVCLAGLFHSVYGTKTFKLVTMATLYRQHIRALIGEHAESLVYIFCLSDRKKLLMGNQSVPFFWTNHLTNERTKLGHEALGDLVEIEAANYVEQLPFGTVKSDAVFQDMRIRFESAESLMSVNAWAAIQQVIDDYVQLYSV
jgi:hypothetical protein